MDYMTAARRQWPAAEWIIGDGRYASVAYCGTTTVMLFRTLAEAVRAKQLIDRTACGHDCRVEHEVRDLRLVTDDENNHGGHVTHVTDVTDPA